MGDHSVLAFPRGGRAERRNEKASGCGARASASRFADAPTMEPTAPAAAPMTNTCAISSSTRDAPAPSPSHPRRGGENVVAAKKLLVKHSTSPTILGSRDAESRAKHCVFSLRQNRQHHMRMMSSLIFWRIRAKRDNSKHARVKEWLLRSWRALREAPADDAPDRARWPPRTKRTRRPWPSCRRPTSMGSRCTSNSRKSSVRGPNCARTHFKTIRDVSHPSSVSRRAVLAERLTPPSRSPSRTLR